MEFDVRTLRPTYRLTIGSIGSSNALEIAERLGMPPAILADARALLDAESAGEYTPMLEQVRLARQEAEERRERMQFLEREADRLKGEYEETLARLKAEEARTEAGIGLQMREILERLHKEADRLHEDLRHGHKTVARRVREVRDGLSECLEKVNALLKGHRLERALKPGDEVYVVKLHRWGNVERVDRRANRAKVRVGETQIDVELADLQPWGEGL